MKQWTQGHKHRKSHKWWMVDMLCMWPCSCCGWRGSFSPSVHSHKVEIWLLIHTQPPHSKSAQFIRISWGTPPLPFPSCCRFYHIRLLHNPSITLTECAVSCGSLQSACYVIIHFVQTQGFFPQSQHSARFSISMKLCSHKYHSCRLPPLLSVLRPGQLTK